MLNWKKLFVYPAAIYAVIFLFISALIGFKINQTAGWVTWATLAISIIGLYIAARAAKLKSTKDTLILGITWVAVMIVLDLVLTMPFTGAVYFKTWNTYLAYAVTLLVPIFFAKGKE